MAIDEGRGKALAREDTQGMGGKFRGHAAPEFADASNAAGAPSLRLRSTQALAFFTGMTLLPFINEKPNVFDPSRTYRTQNFTNAAVSGSHIRPDIDLPLGTMGYCISDSGAQFFQRWNSIVSEPHYAIALNHNYYRVFAVSCGHRHRMSNPHEVGAVPGQVRSIGEGTDEREYQDQLDAQESSHVDPTDKFRVPFPTRHGHPSVLFRFSSL
jgi:hypothetical protein